MDQQYAHSGAGPAVLVELTGGLANQLFQWAAGRLVADAGSRALYLDVRVVERPDGRGNQVSGMVPVDGIISAAKAETEFWRIAHRALPRPVVGAAKRMRRLTFRRPSEIVAKSYAEGLAALTVDRPVRLRGLFQEIDPLLKAREPIVSAVRFGLMNGESADVGHYAAAHIRRGDYASNPKYAARFGLCSEDYYRTALRFIDDRLPVRVVTDDPQWAAGFIASLPSPDRFRLEVGADHFADLRTLANARELIIANSTFSWWGAFLGAPQRVIYPQPWFTRESDDHDLALPGWVPVPRDKAESE
ncbi:alpha-1,2-fucosyltransferase [Micromonospora sicca]|nr:alpha-1,2-fucosyltransferase [Micromonospora sp. 4G51]